MRSTSVWDTSQFSASSFIPRSPSDKYFGVTLWQLQGVTLTLRTTQILPSVCDFPFPQMPNEERLSSLKSYPDPHMKVGIAALKTSYLCLAPNSSFVGHTSVAAFQLTNWGLSLHQATTKVHSAISGLSGLFAELLCQLRKQSSCALPGSCLPVQSCWWHTKEHLSSPVGSLKWRYSRSKNTSSQLAIWYQYF